jgi:hypothetical protein
MERMTGRYCGRDIRLLISAGRREDCQLRRRASLTGNELDRLMAEFDEIEYDLVNLSNVLGLAYGTDWCGRGLRLAQVLRALKEKVEDHGYDQLCSDDRAAFQSAQDRRPSIPRTPSALEMTVRERRERTMSSAARTGVQAESSSTMQRSGE